MSILVVRGRRLVCPDGIVDGSIVIEDGVIRAVERSGAAGAAGASVDSGPTIVEAGDTVVLPGLVDTHVHVNEPGRTDWEGFATATQAAAAGGVTTIVDMPLNSIPATIDAAALAAKRAAAERQSFVDVAFWGGVVPGNARELVALHEAGVCGFKCFLSPSGVPEFDHVAEADLRMAFPALARCGAVLLAHAEDPSLLRPIPPNADVRSHRTWATSRPPQAEGAAIELLLNLSREFGVRVHIVHVAAADALPLLARAKDEGLRVTAETCPHYLTFADEDVPEGATEFKCAPPLRGASNRDRLWDGLADRTLDAIASDHSPSLPALKCLDTGDFLRAWGGIASVQLGLPIVWTGARQRDHSLQDVARWMCEAPARLAGLGSRKGRLAPGFDADLVFLDAESSFVVEPSRLLFRHPVTPYAGRRLSGVVRKTMLRGEPIYDDGRILGPARGRLLRPFDL